MRVIKKGNEMKEKAKSDFNKEERDLTNRLKQLEEKYKNALFSDSGKEGFGESGELREIEKPIEEIKEIEKPVEEIKEIEKPKRAVVEELRVRDRIADSSEEKLRPVEEVKPKKLKVSLSSKKIKIKKKSLKGVVRPTESEIRVFAENIKKMKKELAKVLIGQEEIVDGMIRGLICNGHVLIEGVPGIAKTLAIRALASVSGCEVKRIQFTVDLLPTDIVGITSYTPEKGFEVIKGPIFANFLIADEINRSPPKTQSALIEGMQERQATIGRKTYPLPSPFFVMATINPLESAGVYPLPEAQIDRFLFKIIMKYPKEEEEMKIMEHNMSLKKFEDFALKPVITTGDIMKMQNVVKKIYLDESIKRYILEIVKTSRNKQFKDSEYLTYGGSPRATIGLFIASKAKALMDGRNYVIPEDVKAIIYEILRHRLILSYKATLKKISSDDIIKNILNAVKVG